MHTDAESANILKITREWAAENGVINFYDQQGICHVVTPERGHLRPGMFAVGGDSHSPTGGAFGAYMFGIGATDMLGVLVTGETWVRVPETIQINWSENSARLYQQRIWRSKCAVISAWTWVRYQAIQYTGETITALDIFERMTICNMATELGAQAGLIEPDAKTVDRLHKGAGSDPGDWEQFQGDDGARVAATHNFDAGALTPQVAAPHSPANATDIANMEKVEIDQFYIGACTGAKLNDLKMAADVLTNKKVGPGKTADRGASLSTHSHPSNQIGDSRNFTRCRRQSAATGLWRLCGVWRWRAGRG